MGRGYLEKQLVEGRGRRRRRRAWRWRWLYPKDMRLIGILCSIPFNGFIHLMTIW